MKKAFISIVVLFAVCVQIAAQTPKYVFYFIGDGMGMNQAYAAQATGAQVNFMEFPVRTFISTTSASSLVTDSSAAGTALATGVKIKNSALGMDPEGNSPKTVAEYAKEKGMGTGVATSVGMNHATPASFYAHVPSRNFYSQIADQFIESKMDFAAGSTILITSKDPTTPMMFVEKAKANGIEVFCGKNQYKSVKGKRVMYLSDKLLASALPYAIDRQSGDMKLADFTQGAIDYLSANYPKGFFLMVEGGKIDSACHANDAAATVQEVLDFAESIQLALDFAKKHPSQTLIVVTADHETGGFTMGAGSYEMRPQILASQKLSKDALSAKIAQLRRVKKDDVSWTDIKALLSSELGLWTKIPVSKHSEQNFTDVYKQVILDNSGVMDENLYSKNDLITKAAVDYVNKSAMTTFAFGSHSGAPVPLYVYGAKADSFKDCVDNTDVPKTILKVTGWGK